MKVRNCVAVIILLSSAVIAASTADCTVGKDEYSDYATVKLSPTLRAEEISTNRYNINVAEILPYLSNAIFFDKDEQFKKLPFVSSYMEDNLIGGTGSQFFVQGANDLHNTIYTILRGKNTYKHPDTREALGTEFIAIGTAKLIENSENNIKMEVIDSICSIELNDKIIPRIDLNLPEFLHGNLPDKQMQGYILDVQDGLWDVGKYHSVLVSLGARDGLEPGNILKILRMTTKKDVLANDTYQYKRRREKPKVKFSSTKYGELVIYKVFAKVSLGIVVDAKYPITVLDVVESGEKSS